MAILKNPWKSVESVVAFYAKRTQFPPFLAQKQRFKAKTNPNEPNLKPIIGFRLAFKSEYQNPKSCPPQADLPAESRFLPAYGWYREKAGEPNF
ncbi:MAG: hypothetical protein JW804_06040 [Sedimentisphaerales bacterium]|nr:hypothetical protein [Sedimentisphaerales bacterium]